MSKWHFSADPRENYKGLDVPAGHGALFRAMDGQDRFYAEIMRKQQEEEQLTLKNALNQAAQKAMGELNHVKNNHLTVFNTKVKDEISIKTLDPFIAKLLKKNPILDLSNYNIEGHLTIHLCPSTLSVPGYIWQSYKLKDSIHIQNTKDNIRNLFKDYREIYNNISHPFKSVIGDLFKAGSQVEIDSIKNAFLQNSNHLNTYFEYSEDNNNQSPISEILCKESLLRIVENIGLKLESLNEAQSEQNDQEYLSRLASSNEEEKIPHDDRYDDISELENAPQKNAIPESQDDLMRMIEQLRASLKEKDDYIGDLTGENEHIKEVVTQQAVQIDGLTQGNIQLQERLQHSEENNRDLRQDKSDLREHVSDLRESNLEKAARLEEVNQVLVTKQLQYDILKDQFDSIIGQEVPQNLENDHGSQLSGVGSGLSIDSFEIV